MSSHVIRDRIWESKKLARCSREASLAYPWIFLVADDWGRFEFNPRRIWSKVFGAREDVAVADVTLWLEEYEREELLIRYHIDGELAYWTGFQGRSPSQRRASLYPDPATVTTKCRRKRTPTTPAGVAYKEDRQSLGDPYPLSEQSRAEERAEQKVASPRSADAQAALDYWLKATGSTIRSDAVRTAHLKRADSRLREGATLEDLKACVDHATTDPFYIERKYSRDPAVFWKNAERVEKLAAQRRAPPVDLFQEPEETPRQRAERRAREAEQAGALS